MGSIVWAVFTKESQESKDKPSGVSMSIILMS
jgi:hypothetical protein